MVAVQPVALFDKPPMNADWGRLSQPALHDRKGRNTPFSGAARLGGHGQPCEIRYAYRGVGAETVDIILRAAFVSSFVENSFQRHTDLDCSGHGPGNCAHFLGRIVGYPLQIWAQRRLSHRQMASIVEQVAQPGGDRRIDYDFSITDGHAAQDAIADFAGYEFYADNIAEGQNRRCFRCTIFSSPLAGFSKFLN